MFDFPYTESNIITSCYVWVLYIVVLGANYKYLKAPVTFPNYSDSFFWTIFIGFALVTFCVQGDFFSLMKVVHDFESYGSDSYAEEIYVEIGNFIGSNYILFRTIIWGGAFALFCYTAKNMNTSVFHAAVILYLTHGLIFGYARVTSAMALYFAGLSLICTCLERINIIKLIIGVALIILCTLFHKSSSIMIVMTVLIIVPINRYTVVAAIILIPAFIFQIRGLLENIIFSQGMDERIVAKFNTYTNGANRLFGPAELIGNALEYISFYLPFIIISVRLFSKNNRHNIPIRLMAFYKVSLGLIFCSITFYLFGSGFYVFIYRIMYMTMIPLAILIVKLYDLGILSYKDFKWCVVPGVFMMIFKITYNVYTSAL